VNTSTMLAALMVGGGLSLVVVGMLLRVRRRDAALAEILDLPFGERDVDVAAVAERGVVQGTVGLASRVVEQFDTKGSLGQALERARIPMRPGEYLVVTVCATIALAAVLSAMTATYIFGVIGIAIGATAGYMAPRYLLHRRRKAFETQLPDALSLIAGSLSAGHTFLRAIQMMCEEAEAPLSEEFARVVSETRLGDPLIDSLERMARRLEVRDLVWVVQAIRIQQTVGGKLGDLLHTLADFIRAREEIRREVLVLTAEGRISAWVLGALPVFLLLMVRTVSPDYMDPLFQGTGLFLLLGAAASVVVGVLIIRRMVQIDV
jgi:tight adherence protein B